MTRTSHSHARGNGYCRSRETSVTTPICQIHVEKAAKNWCEWQCVYEHTGAACNNPLLTDRTKFGKFLKRYSVGRRIRCGTSEVLRRLLGSPEFQLTALLKDTTGATLDRQNDELREQFGTHKGRHGLTSALSKIAAFLAPHAFNAWDTHARKGLRRALQGQSVRVRTVIRRAILTP